MIKFVKYLYKFTKIYNTKSDFPVKMISLETSEETRESLPRQVKNMKTTIDISDEETTYEVDIVKPSGPRVTLTGKTLDQNKMLRRKMKNCDNKGWITLESGGQYPKQALVTLKTGMFELFKNNFLNFMKSFKIHPSNKQKPDDSIKLTRNENGI